MSDEQIVGAPTGGEPTGQDADRTDAADASRGPDGQTRGAFLKRAAVLGVGTAVTGSVLAACGGGGGASTQAAAPAPSGAAAAKPNIAAKYKNKSIGVALLTASDENTLSIKKWAEQATKDADLNWSWKTVDTQASSSAAQEALNSFLTQKVDGIIDVAIGASTIEAQLKQAAEANVPVVGTYAFAEPDSSILQDYTLPPSVDASLLAHYMIMDLQNRYPSGKIQVGLLDFPLDLIQERRTAVKGLLAENSRFEIVAEEFSVSPTNTEQDATAKAKALMQSNPDLKAIWCNYPPIAVPAAAAVEQVGKTGEVQVYGHIATSAGVEGLRGGNGAMTATSWVDWPYVGYMLVDQLLEAMSGKTLNKQLSTLRPDPSIVFDSSNVETEVPKGTKAADWMFAGGTYRVQFLNEWNEKYGK